MTGFRQIIASIEAACERWGRAPLPAWATLRLDAGAKQGVAPAPVVWIDPQEPDLLATEARLVEFLDSRAGTALAGKLDRINCPQALALWRQPALLRTRTPLAAAVAYAVRSTAMTTATTATTATTVRFATEGVPWPGLQEMH